MKSPELLMKKWPNRIGLGLVVFVALTLVAGASFEALSRANAARSFPALGRLVDIGGGRHIQLDCRGTGSPIVIFESGLDTLGSLSWVRVHDEVAKTTRACAYSRAGIMWSDPASAPFDVRLMASDLHKALAAAGEKPPFVMVGHSLGGPYVLTYTGLYGGDVSGLVFVDASHPDQDARFRKVLGGDVQPPIDLVEILAENLTWSGAVRLFAPKITPDHAPPQTDMAAAAWLPQSIRASVGESKRINHTSTVAGQYRRLGDRPLVVLTAAPRSPTPAELEESKSTPDQWRRIQAEWHALHDDEASWSTRGRHQVVPGASHYIQFDQPQVVSTAIGDVVDQVRADALAPKR